MPPLRPASALLSVADLHVERGGRVVLSDLSFDLAAGEVLLVTGRNGAGKSTLLRALAGLLPFEGGRIMIAGEDEAFRGTAMHYCGYADALKATLSVAENLAFWATAWGAAAASVPDALAAFGVQRLAAVPAAHLSAGQRRRVALARLLLSPRPIWLLDEPLTALDAGAQMLLGAAMAAHGAGGGAIVVASHVSLDLPHRIVDLDRRA